MALTHEQYADSLMRVARIQQKLQAHYLLPLMMEKELNGERSFSGRVDLLRAAAARPTEILELKKELRQTQSQVKEYERLQGATGKIRVLREKVTLAEKLEKARENHKKLQNAYERLAPGGVRGFLLNLFRRKQVEQAHIQLMRSEREIQLLRMAAPRPRQSKALKKAIQQQFAEKSERELKRDLHDMNKTLGLYRQAERDRLLTQHFQELAQAKGFARLALTIQQINEWFSGRSLVQRNRRVDAAQGVRVVDEKAVERKKPSLWQSIVRPGEVYAQQAAELKERLALYQGVPSKREAERLTDEIKAWESVLKRRQMQRQEQEAAVKPKKQRKRSQTKKRDQIKNQQLTTEVKHKHRESKKERIVRLDPVEVEKLRVAQIEFQIVKEKDKTYAVLETNGVQEREYKGIQVVFARELIPLVEKTLGRSITPDPEVGTVRHAEMKKKPGKNLLVHGLNQEQLEVLKREGIPFSGFEKQGNLYSIYVKQDVAKLNERLKQLIEGREQTGPGLERSNQFKSGKDATIEHPNQSGTKQRQRAMER